MTAFIACNRSYQGGTFPSAPRRAELDEPPPTARLSRDQSISINRLLLTPSAGDFPVPPRRAELDEPPPTARLIARSIDLDKSTALDSISGRLSRPSSSSRARRASPHRASIARSIDLDKSTALDSISGRLSRPSSSSRARRSLAPTARLSRDQSISINRLLLTPSAGDFPVPPRRAELDEPSPTARQSRGQSTPLRSSSDLTRRQGGRRGAAVAESRVGRASACHFICNRRGDQDGRTHRRQIRLLSMISTAAAKSLPPPHHSHEHWARVRDEVARMIDGGPALSSYGRRPAAPAERRRRRGRRLAGRAADHRQARAAPRLPQVDGAPVVRSQRRRCARVSSRSSPPRARRRIGCRCCGSGRGGIRRSARRCA